MTTPDPEVEKAHSERESSIHRQIAFASGIFQNDITTSTLLESLPDGIVIVDISGTILLTNALADKMFGYAEGELTGKPHTLLIPERFRKVHEEHQENFFAEPKIRPMGLLLDLTVLRQDGSEFPVEISLSFVQTINGLFVLAFINNITFRKEFETRIQENEEQFLIQVEWMKDYAIFLLDKQGNVMTWNSGAERLKGYRSVEIIGEHFSIFYTDEERKTDKPSELLKTAASEGQVVTEGWRIRKDGSRFWAEVVITSLRDKSGNLRGFSKVTHDITERKRVEQELRESEDKFYKVFNFAPIGMTISTLNDGRFVEINEAGERQSGYPREEVIGRTSAQFSIWGDSSERAQVIGEVVKNGAVRDREMLMKGKEGNAFWGLFSAVPIEIKGEKHLLSLVSDITERKKTEETLKSSETRYRRLFEAAKDGILILSVDTGRINDVNPCLLELLGYKREEVINKMLWDIGMFPDIPASMASFAELQQQEYVHYEDLPLLTRDGRRISVEFVSNVYVVDGTKVIQCNIRDISERKLTEEKIAKLNTDLAARAYELEIANEDLKAFNYTIAHDLRQPLNVVSLYCQSLKIRCKDQLQEECKDYVQKAHDTALHMNHLIETILNFSHVGQVTPRLVTVDFSALARGVAEELKQSEPKRMVDFRIEDGVVAHGDADLLKAVLDNLFGNAWKYTGRQENACIEFGVRSIDGVPTYFIRDNGVGFDMTDAHKLFAPFERLPDAEKGSGFGIGLATVERIIRRHGGKVWAEGELDKGACIYFTLPEHQISI